MSHMGRYPKKIGKVHGDKMHSSRRGRMSNAFFVKMPRKDCINPLIWELKSISILTCISMRGGRLGSAAPISRMICASLACPYWRYWSRPWKSPDTEAITWALAREKSYFNNSSWTELGTCICSSRSAISRAKRGRCVMDVAALDASGKSWMNTTFSRSL